ncbi:hypothetical protein BGZ93_010112 [Podila epicladia]|nr:hypothetical protein BGZ92_009510 [Podila epicladia]KAG0098857.1 hypothetical protein BGZ93_010112 [Podila epicladia]
MTYSFNEVTKIHQLLFNCRWPVNVNEIGYIYTIPPLGKFTFNIKKADGAYAFTVSTEWIDVAKLSMFQTCAVSMEDRTRISFSRVKFAPTNNVKQHVTSIPCNQLLPAGEKFYLSFQFSSSNTQEDPEPTLGDTILEKLYCDTTYDDVSFVFDSNAIPPSWPYFKAMFEGGFAESGPGEQRIMIQDTKMKTFELLLRFMYTGQLPDHLDPTIMYSDGLEEIEDVSMEDLFLAADRYDIQELRDQTLEPLLDSLDNDNAIPFLFRTAYKFSELRKPVIQFVAKSCGSSIGKKNIRTTYRDHPDVLDIVMDLLEVYHETQS